MGAVMPLYLAIRRVLRATLKSALYSVIDPRKKMALFGKVLNV